MHQDPEMSHLSGGAHDHQSPDPQAALPFHGGKQTHTLTQGETDPVCTVRNWICAACWASSPKKGMSYPQADSISIKSRSSLCLSTKEIKPILVVLQRREVGK